MDEPRLPDSRRGLFFILEGPVSRSGIAGRSIAGKERAQKDRRACACRVRGPARAGIFFMDMPETFWREWQDVFCGSPLLHASSTSVQRARPSVRPAMASSKGPRRASGRQMRTRAA